MPTTAIRAVTIASQPIVRARCAGDWPATGSVVSSRSAASTTPSRASTIESRCANALRSSAAGLGVGPLTISSSSPGTHLRPEPEPQQHDGCCGQAEAEHPDAVEDRTGEPAVADGGEDQLADDGAERERKEIPNDARQRIGRLTARRGRRRLVPLEVVNTLLETLEPLAGRLERLVATRSRRDERCQHGVESPLRRVRRNIELQPNR